MLKFFLLIFFVLISGCREGDYMLVYKDPETQIIEVPVYIEVEVPIPTGTPAEEVEIWVDSFVQVRAVDGVDIIWVIDTSGSMGQYQSNLLAGIEHMMNALPLGGWRLVMVPTDPSKSVIEQQFPLVPGDTIVDAEDMYNAMQRGPAEKGFDAIFEYIEHNPYAASWMRHDAALLVVFVSDEDDQSDILIGASDFVSWYVPRRFGNVYLASVVMQEDAFSLCPDSPGSQAGLAYIDATNILFGTTVDICADDWTPGVTDATSQIEPYEYLELTHLPIPETIRVFVNGLQYHSWAYDEPSNSVLFTVVPSGGSLVEAGYVIKQ